MSRIAGTVMRRDDRNDNYKPLPTCCDCGLVISSEEARYYGTRCERCERVWHDKMRAANR